MPKCGGNKQQYMRYQELCAGGMEVCAAYNKAKREFNPKYAKYIKNVIKSHGERYRRAKGVKPQTRISEGECRKRCKERYDKFYEKLRNNPAAYKSHLESRNVMTSKAKYGEFWQAHRNLIEIEKEISRKE